ncbi:hypothetical protein OGATHE_002829 [Ogataea polymorpha]|uniref:Uncharacterized protein n=1 Tax=Ogataea polymorpha TaxID=460523 RepID=A0A9P8PDW1_9ASCO|nr:hypothetical protein OGATHE_002829 [Ogataea polymorpha]
MRIPETPLRIVWVSWRVCVSVVDPVLMSPHLDRSFNSRSSEEGEKDFHRQSAIIGSVSPVSVISSSDGETTKAVQYHCGHKSVKLQRNPFGGDQSR